MNKKEHSLLKILLLLALSFMYIILYLITCKYYIISFFYIHFTLIIIAISILLILLIFTLKRKINSMLILFIIVMCINSSLLFLFEKRVVKESQKVEFKNETYFFENHNFLQNEIVVKRKSFIFFSNDIGKIIIPKNCEYNISSTPNTLQLNVEYDEKTISYVIDYLNNSIIEKHE